MPVSAELTAFALARLLAHLSVTGTQKILLKLMDLPELAKGDRVSCLSRLFYAADEAKKQLVGGWETKVDFGAVLSTKKDGKICVEWADGTKFTPPREHLTKVAASEDDQDEAALGNSSDNSSVVEESDDPSSVSDASSKDSSSSGHSSATSEEKGQYLLNPVIGLTHI